MQKDARLQSLATSTVCARQTLESTVSTHLESPEQSRRAWLGQTRLPTATQLQFDAKAFVDLRFDAQACVVQCKLRFQFATS